VKCVAATRQILHLPDYSTWKALRSKAFVDIACTTIVKSVCFYWYSSDSFTNCYFQSMQYITAIRSAWKATSSRFSFRTCAAGLCHVCLCTASLPKVNAILHLLPSTNSTPWLYECSAGWFISVGSYRIIRIAFQWNVFAFSYVAPFSTGGQPRPWCSLEKQDSQPLSCQAVLFW
jgi:hypothetical protein